MPWWVLVRAKDLETNGSVFQLPAPSVAPTWVSMARLPKGEGCGRVAWTAAGSLNSGQTALAEGWVDRHGGGVEAIS